jgi:hypothetical protein
VEGTAKWLLSEAPQTVELRLFWYTKGKGTQDIEIVESVPFEHPQLEDARPFRVTLPASPYSFSGKLISLLWALELVAKPGEQSVRVEITMSPTGEEVVLRK